ncbi:hypothetical protein [Streptomyces sp. IMTB 1903]|uniref:hypothetical protein n=1 Tax=Streptomyces sp. IMTB 1903 TaxID=1776680 RepID=UPI000755DB03|nr:hypothetical protein [Streptomyces sp. IMTB 1903]
MLAVAQRGHGVEGLAEDVVVGGGQRLDGRWERASGPGEGLGGHASGRAGELELLVALAGLLLQQLLELGVLGDVAEGQRGVVDQEEVLGGEAVVEGAGAGCADHLDREAALHGYLVGTQVAGGGGETDDHRVGGRFGEGALSEVGGKAGLDAQFAGEDAVALAVGVAQAVPVFVGDLLVGLAHGLDDLADQFLLVLKRLFQVGPVGAAP